MRGQRAQIGYRRLWVAQQPEAVAEQVRGQGVGGVAVVGDPHPADARGDDYGRRRKGVSRTHPRHERRSQKCVPGVAATRVKPPAKRPWSFTLTLPEALRITTAPGEPHALHPFHPTHDTPAGVESGAFGCA
jgi:hypothetical protein